MSRVSDGLVTGCTSSSDLHLLQRLRKEGAYRLTIRWRQSGVYSGGCREWKQHASDRSGCSSPDTVTVFGRHNRRGCSRWRSCMCEVVTKQGPKDGSIPISPNIFLFGRTRNFLPVFRDKHATFRVLFQASLWYALSRR